MKVKIVYFGTGETDVWENVKSVDIRSGDTCLVVNFKDDSWKLIDTDKNRVMIAVIE